MSFAVMDGPSNLDARDLNGEKVPAAEHDLDVVSRGLRDWSRSAPDGSRFGSPARCSVVRSRGGCPVLHGSVLFATIASGGMVLSIASPMNRTVLARI